MGETLKVIAAVATALVALYVAYIGTLQWMTARDKLRLDLYNRRFDIYTRAIDFVNAASRWADLSEDERQTIRMDFVKAVRESRFLFADDQRIMMLLNEINRRSFKISGFYEMARDYLRHYPQEYASFYQEKQLNLEWIMDSTARLDELLLPYLAFRQRILKPFREGLLDSPD